MTAVIIPVYAENTSSDDCGYQAELNHFPFYGLFVMGGQL